MKKITALLLAIFLFVSFFQTLSFAAGKINILYDNKFIDFSPLPVTVNGRTYVPIQPFFTKLGANSYFNASNKVYTIYFNGDYLKFQVSKGILSNLTTGKSITIRNPRYYGQYYMPLRSVMEFLGHSVDWIGRSSRILINSPKRFIPVINYGPLIPKSQIKNYAGRNEIINVDNFEAQMKYLSQKGYKALTLKDIEGFLNGKKIDEKSVLITFDGGHISSYTYAYPILKKYRLKGIMFVETASIGGHSSYVNWSQLKEMYDSNIMDVQSLTHDLNKFDGGYKILQARPSEIIKDLKISKQLIEALVENKVYALAYPFGIYNDAIITYAREAGFKMAFTIKGDNIKKNSDIMTLKRSNIYNWMNLSQFIKTLEKY